jgi:hypothetical protein
MKVLYIFATVTYIIYSIQDVDQFEMDKRKRTEGQNTTLNIKDRAKRTPLKTGGDLVCSGRVSSWSSWRYLLTIFFRQF